MKPSDIQIATAMMLAETTSWEQKRPSPTSTFGQPGFGRPSVSRPKKAKTHGKNKKKRRK